MKKQKRACIFDLDGTLLHTLPTVLFSCNATLRHFGLDSIDEQQCRDLYRHPVRTFYLELARLGGAENPADAEAALRAYDTAHYFTNNSETTLFAGVEELLQMLKNADVATGVLTNKLHDIAQELTEQFCPGLIDICVGAAPGRQSKPDPTELLRMIDAMGVAREDCVFVGDTDVDMKTAKAAGVFAVAVNWGYMDEAKLLTYHPDLLIRHPMELLPLFE